MRVSVSNDDFQVKAIGGTYVVLLAIEPKRREATTDLRGFSISRAIDGHPATWLRGIKFFDGTAPNWKPGDDFSSEEQPIQSFFWSDPARRSIAVLTRRWTSGATSRGTTASFPPTSGSPLSSTST